MRLIFMSIGLCLAADGIAVSLKANREVWPTSYAPHPSLAAQEKDTLQQAEVLIAVQRVLQSNGVVDTTAIELGRTYLCLSEKLEECAPQRSDTLDARLRHDLRRALGRCPERGTPSTTKVRLSRERSSDTLSAVLVGVTRYWSNGLGAESIVLVTKASAENSTLLYRTIYQGQLGRASAPTAAGRLTDDTCP
jgi:hypothetical protein